MSKLFAYISLGTSIFTLVPILAAQFKTPSTLDSALVWSEIEPIIMQLSMATGHTINTVLAQKIVDSAVVEIKKFVP